MKICSYIVFNQLFQCSVRICKTNSSARRQTCQNQHASYMDQNCREATHFYFHKVNGRVSSWRCIAPFIWPKYLENADYFAHRFIDIDSGIYFI